MAYKSERNDAMRQVATSARARFADPVSVFNPAGGEAAAICALTLLCTENDSHPSDTGYRALADLVFDASGYQRLNRCPARPQTPSTHPGGTP